jgi:hypothetical protein
MMGMGKVGTNVKRLCWSYASSNGKDFDTDH